MEEEKSKVEDVLELFLEIFEPADIFGNFLTNIFKSSNLTGKKDIKTFQDLISFCSKLDTSKRTAKQQTDSEAIWRTRCVEYVDAVLALRLETRTLGWRALLKILSYLHNYGPQKQEYLRECKRILDYLISSNVNCQRESDRDYNVTLFCLNLLECVSSIPMFPISHGELSVALFRDIFKICHRVAFTHSSGTLTAFKCLAILVEIAGKCSVCSDDICSEICYKNELFDIIMANWENPVPAVRKLVEELLRAWIKCDENCYRNWPMKCGCSVNCQSDLLESILDSVTWKHGFEYRMIVTLLECIGIDRVRQVISDTDGHGKKIRTGLTISLRNHDLASPGADLYRTLLTILSQTEWTYMLDKFIKDHLHSDNRMVITNIFKHWMPSTLDKYPQYWPVQFESMSSAQNSSSLCYLSMIRLWKIKRKSGNWQPKGVDHDFLERCLQCSDEDVRCNAFGVVCETSTLTNVQAWEYQLVKQFLVENINYDRSNLRQSMVNYCVTFFLRVRGSVIAKQSSTEDAVNFVEDLYQFLSANLEKHCNYQRKMTSLMLYNAVLIYFGIGGGQERNQRKSNTKEKSGVVEEEATAARKWHFRSKTSRKLLLSCIDDISDSVRNLAADILINHFKFDEDDQEELNHLYNIGKGMCSSKLFYEIESGALLIKTATILAFKSDYSLISNMLKNSNPKVFNESKIIPTVTFDLINLAKTQLSVISKDIFMAVLHCHPLHGVLRALMLLLTDKTEFNYTETLKNSKEIQKIFKETKSGTFSTFSNTLANYLAKNKQDLIDDIVDIVEEMFTKKCEAKNRSSSCELLEDIITIMEKDVSTMIALLSYSQDNPSEDGDFALVNTPEFSPSFADMGNSLEEIVRQSEISSSNDEVLMLPVSHQLVLNCIWFNLKICCMFASGLITSGVVQCMEGSCCRCFSILETVLNKCRHKGAMDIAGSSMFSAAKSVMNESQQFSTEDRSLPAKILDNLLRNISADASCSLSRRSAGRAFLVHSIVASDPRPNSPLLGKTLSKLIEIIGENSSSSLEGNIINDSLVDTPLVSALHILSTLVQDSRLNVLPYAKEIFCICFDKLSSPIYTVKNAALQLFKSLLMRLMRRMKGDSSQNDSDLDNYHTTPLQDLFFHMPQLFSFVEKKLKNLSSEPDIITHAKLMPILVLLSNISITCFKKYNKKYAQFAHNIKKYVEKLFSSPLYFVRKLSARISVNLLLPEEMLTEVTLTTISIEQACSSDFLDQNLLHGLVMNFKYLSLRLVFLREIHDLSSKGEFEDMFQCLTTLIKLPETTYFLKSLAVDVIKLWQPSVNFGTKQDNCVTINSSISHYKPHLGSSLWLAKIVENICAKDASSNLKKLCLLENNITDVALAFLRVCVLAPSTDEAENDSGLVMAVMKSSHEPEVIEQLMKKLLNGFVSNDLKLFDFILSLVKKPRVRYKFVDVGLGMLVACRILSSLSDDEFYSKNRLYKILEIFKCLSAWSSPSQTNEDLRNIAAECVPCFRAFFLKRMTTTDLIETDVFDLETDKLGSFLWQILFNLLQDENLDIRMTACRFFPDFYSTTNLDVPNPFVALQKLMKIQFMLQIMNLRTAIDQLWNVFSLESRAAPIKTTSPFDHGIDNFYKDETWLQQTIQTEFKLISDESDFVRNYLKKRYQYTVSS